MFEGVLGLPANEEEESQHHAAIARTLRDGAAMFTLAAASGDWQANTLTAMHYREQAAGIERELRDLPDMEQPSYNPQAYTSPGFYS